jgi:hypothetical protein
MGLNQAPIVVMIENHRTGLVWDRFMANPKSLRRSRRSGSGRIEATPPRERAGRKLLEVASVPLCQDKPILHGGVNVPPRR